MWCFCALVWYGLMFTTSYYYLIPMQWFLSTQPLNQNHARILIFHFLSVNWERKRTNEWINRISISNLLEHEKLDAIVLDIFCVYWMGKVMCYWMYMCMWTNSNKKQHHRDQRHAWHTGVRKKKTKLWIS